MNLPIKLVDLVTLLFLSLLVVIIIFIILQRNIKRFKLRNVKDPHFLTCKSIPNDLKEAILLKHIKSHEYNAPPQLLTFNHMKNSDDKTKPFLIRMKAYETSKYLEYALCDFGYRRPISTKFEEFILLLINHNDDSLPKELLKSYHGYYLWAMLDPMVFEMKQLREHNLLINSIIEKLASIKKSNSSDYNKIIQHKLELNPMGDFDFKSQNIPNNLAKSSFYDSKLSKNQKDTKSFNININTGEIKASTSNESHPMTIPNQYSKSTSKSTHKNSKNIFRKQSNSSSLKNEEDQDKQQLIMDTSFESMDTSKTKTTSFSNSKKQQPTKSKKEFADYSDDLEENTDQKLKWASTAKKSDAETEKIPLVSAKKSHQKKKSNNSEKIILDPLLKSTAKNASSTTNMTTQLSNLNKINSASENEGFNQTFESNI